MRKVIKGRKYDTETAKEIGVMCINWTDRLRREDEILYQKEDGEFFLHGSGGPMTKYARSYTTNNVSGGEEIIPLSVGEAKRWAEKNMDVDEYEAVFGVVPEHDGTKKVTWSLPIDLVKKVQQKAEQSGISFGEVVEKALEAYLR